ncbi:hypothetical protein QBC35DRAFT_498147 [Podospora australis]|uniref:Uncharacterized protein n=1 Tax=Podospora australis TaxID=1536484 RepID=A0AAN7AHT3_9PEZI|nr:hypothetical protein QBC35DRAFT_498147 [Podospora australis]
MQPFPSVHNSLSYLVSSPAAANDTAHQPIQSSPVSAAAAFSCIEPEFTMDIAVLPDAGELCIASAFPFAFLVSLSTNSNCTRLLRVRKTSSMDEETDPPPDRHSAIDPPAKQYRRPPFLDHLALFQPVKTRHPNQAVYQQMRVRLQPKNNSHTVIGWVAMSHFTGSPIRAFCCRHSGIGTRDTNLQCKRAIDRVCRRQIMECFIPRERSLGDDHGI